MGFEPMSRAYEAREKPAFSTTRCKGKKIMTTEQYEKAEESYRQIKGLREWISFLEYEKENPIAIHYPGKVNNPEFETSRFLFNARVRNNVTSYIHFNEIAIRAELIDFAKDEIAKLEDKLKEI